MITKTLVLTVDANYCIYSLHAAGRNMMVRPLQTSGLSHFYLFPLLAIYHIACHLINEVQAGNIFTTTRPKSFLPTTFASL